MREILFKANRVDNGEWVEGWYCRFPIVRWPLKDCITPSKKAEAGHYEVVEVDPETVCQYTGITDKNGVKIFEGDIVSYNGSRETVVYDTSLRIPCFTTGVRSGSSTAPHPYKLSAKYVVIGNIHDKKGGEKDETLA